MTTYVKPALVLLLGIILLAACSSNDENPISATNPGAIEKITGTGTDNTLCVDLIAGQSILVGSVCVTEVNTDFTIPGNDHLRVTYTTTGGWEMSEVHFFIGPALPSQNAPRQFPYVFDNWTSNTTSCSFDIPFTYLRSLYPDLYTCYVAMAHAVVHDTNPGGTTQTAWGGGTPTGQAWSMWFPICLEEGGGGGGGGGDPIIETAYGYNALYSTCFIPTFANWGWTNQLDPTLRSFTFDLIAGAGQCDQSKGLNVGTVTLSIGGTPWSSATVTYTMTAPYVLEEVHFYIDALPFPMVQKGKNWVQTVAPGQYPYNYDSGPYTSPAVFNVSIPSGSAYFIAHAVVADY